MRALKIELSAPTTSFRYPHFMVGRHPTYDMPPPATIYGHICSAVGELVPPDSLRFGYHFTCAAHATDYEHLHMISPAAGRGKYTVGGVTYPKNIEATVTPTNRDFLFDAHLTLYVDRMDLKPYFELPVYPVVLGRSQDLATYTRIAEVELQEASAGYLEHTILPRDLRLSLSRGVVVTMPRYLDYGNGRQPSFEQYLVLNKAEAYVYRGKMPDELGGVEAAELGGDGPLLVDPESGERHGSRRVVWLHSFL